MTENGRAFLFQLVKTIIALLNAHDQKFPQFDTKNDSLVPFTAVRPRPVVVKQKQGWGFLGSFIKFIVLVCIAAVAYKYYKGS